MNREAGDRFDEAVALTHLGGTHYAVGELGQAREAWQQALAILEDLQHPDAGQVRQARQHKRPRLPEPVRVTTRRSHSRASRPERATSFVVDQRPARSPNWMIWT
jgi:hypothetical protein